MIDLTWWIKIAKQPGGARFQVMYWMANPPEDSDLPTKMSPTVVVQPVYWMAREWAERIATSWEQTGQPWEIAEDSL